MKGDTLTFKVSEAEVLSFVRNRFLLKFDNDKKLFRTALQVYQELPPFKLNENIFNANPDLDPSLHEAVLYIARVITQFYLTKAFEAMKIDLNDPNVTEDLDEGNIGTPGRIAKMWTASSPTDDSELLCGRWTKPPRIATFPNEHPERKIPITKRVTINAVCSHHAAIFSTQWGKDSYAIISYIPEKTVLGISKLQRLTDWVARRGWLQEELTYELYHQISKAAETKNVYVKMVNVIHSCELNRGSKNPHGGFTTEAYGGLFEDPVYREMVNKDY